MNTSRERGYEEEIKKRENERKREGQTKNQKIKNSRRQIWRQRARPRRPWVSWPAESPREGALRLCLRLRRKGERRRRGGEQSRRRRRKVEEQGRAPLQPLPLLLQLPHSSPRPPPPRRRAPGCTRGRRGRAGRGPTELPRRTRRGRRGGGGRGEGGGDGAGTGMRRGPSPPPPTAVPPEGGEAAAAAAVFGVASVSSFSSSPSTPLVSQQRRAGLFRSRLPRSPRRRRGPPPPPQQQHPAPTATPCACCWLPSFSRDKEQSQQWAAREGAASAEGPGSAEGREPPPPPSSPSSLRERQLRPFPASEQALTPRRHQASCRATSAPPRARRRRLRRPWCCPPGKAFPSRLPRRRARRRPKESTLRTWLVEQPVNTSAAGASTATSNAVLSEVVEVVIGKVELGAGS